MITTVLLVQRLSNLSILECKCLGLSTFKSCVSFQIYPYWNVNVTCPTAVSIPDTLSNLSILECKSVSRDNIAQNIEPFKSIHIGM